MIDYPEPVGGGTPKFDTRLMQALSHPLRVEILERLQEQVLSPAMLKRQMGRYEMNLVSYHVKVLLEYDCIEVFRTRRGSRGADEHLYRAKPDTFLGAAGLRKAPRSVRGSLTGAALQTFIDHAVAALEVGTIDDREDTTLNWMTISVDRFGWDQVVDVVRATRIQLMAIHEQSKIRLAVLQQDGTPLIVGVAAFEMARRFGEGRK